MIAPVERVQRSLRRHGVAGTTQLAAARLGSCAYLREEHLWYALDPATEHPRRELGDGLELRRGLVEDLGLLDQLPTIPGVEALRRLAAGADWWLVVEDGRSAFSCWIFHDRAPVLAARGGWLALPPGIVVLEDSITSPEFRGRSVAPAAWSSIADALAAAGEETLLTKVARDNQPVQRALEKIGFRKVADMRLVRTGPRTRVEIDADATAAGRLVAGLAR